LLHLRITGGGQRSELWNAIKADALQVPLRRVARAEGAPLWISLGQTTRPRRKWAEHYARRRARYAALLEHLDQAWKVGEKLCP